MSAWYLHDWLFNFYFQRVNKTKSPTIFDKLYRKNFYQKFPVLSWTICWSAKTFRDRKFFNLSRFFFSVDLKCTQFRQSSRKFVCLFSISTSSAVASTPIRPRFSVIKEQRFPGNGLLQPEIIFLQIARLLRSEMSTPSCPWRARWRYRCLTTGTTLLKTR